MLQYTTQNLNGQFHPNYIVLRACKSTEGTDDFEAFKLVKKGSKKKALGFAGQITIIGKPQLAG